MEIKGKYPFRLGTTSFILPADIMTNVRYLAGKVDDVELLVFESDEMAELPDVKTVGGLKQIGIDNGLTYTVHLPLDIWLGDADQTERERSINKCLRTIAGMNSIDPFAWILHCNREGRQNSRIDDDNNWAAAVESSVSEILGCGVSPRAICVETLDGSFPLLESMIKKHGLSICLDVGHVLLYQLPFEEYLHKYLCQARVIHLHGVKEGKDHKDISEIDPLVLKKLFEAIHTDTKKDHVVTLEVFSEKDLNASMNTVMAVL